jgi:hypothetical protein
MRAWLALGLALTLVLPAPLAARQGVSVVASWKSGDGAIDTTGANLIVCHASNWTGGGEPCTDSKSNTYTGLTFQTVSSYGGRLWYVEDPTVGTGHDFNNVGPFARAVVIAFSGVDTSGGSFDVENGATNANQPGSVTPSADHAVVVAGASFEPGSVSGIDSDFTIAQTAPNSGGVGASIAYLIQETAAAVNPTWTFGGTPTRALTIAAFVGTAASTGTTPVPAILMRPRVRGGVMR